MTRIVASQISGPTPSPRMTVILCILSRRGTCGIYGTYRTNAWLCPLSPCLPVSLSPCPLAPLSVLPQRLLDCAFGQRRHSLIASGVRVQAGVGQFHFEHPLVVNHVAEVIQVDVAVGCAVAFRPFVELENLFGRATFG